MRILPNVELSAFGIDPWWVTLIKVVTIFVTLVVLTLLAIWGERRIVARMQMRVGPNRVGPGGGPEVSFFGVITPLQLTDFPVSVLYVLAIASVGIYGIVLAGWSSGSTYSLLGGLRSSAQMVSYEIAMGLSFVAVFLYAGSMSTSQIVAAQERTWYILLLLPSFLIYVISMVGETNRAPFDLPEAEGELVGGFHTEYSSLKFALFFLAEYINMVTVSALATTLFLGGWRAPFPFSLIPGANEGWVPLIWFFGKIALFLFVFIWMRGTLPRFRYDQFMNIGWKILIPASLAWIVIVAITRGLRNSLDLPTGQTIALLGLPLIAVALAVFIADWRKANAEANNEEAEVEITEVNPFAGGHPVPPLPGQVLVEPSATKQGILNG